MILTAALTLMLAASCTSGDYLGYADENLRWSLVLESDSAPFAKKVLTCGEKDVPVVTREGKDVIYTYNDFEGMDIDVAIRFAPYAGGKGVEISSTIANNEKGYYVKSMVGPIIEDPAIDLNTWDIYTPWGPGTVFSGTPDVKDADGRLMKNVGLWKLKDKKVYEIKAAYPSGAQHMQYSEFNNGSEGLYLASHDSEMRYKNFIIRYDVETAVVSYGIENMMTCFTGETVTTPGAIIWHHEGDWHAAADVYSEFYHSAVDILDKPEWVDNSTAWMLTIMKQQNNELMWPYNTIGTTMTDAAIARGYNMLGLFGWTVGGHDKYYPEYDVDPVMGGEQALKDGIKAARDRGMKVIMYVNGQLIDTEGTKFWGETGEDIVVRKADGSDYFQMWQKYKDFAARHHGMACQSDPRWKEIMLDLAKQINSYGADGIIYDQLGTTNISYCYAPNHGHSVPAIVYENDKVANLKYVVDEMKKINPEFIVITEGINEAELNSISMFHLAAGTAGKNFFQKPAAIDAFINGSPAGAYFNQMTKYTIPEWTSTNRVQSPVNNRYVLNYCMLCGIRPEIECRYQPDVDYLLEGRMPQDDDYDNMVSKVDISLVKSLDIDAAREYSRQINEFMLANSDLFFKGRFMDTCGYGISADPRFVRSSAFVNGNRMGVLVCNFSDSAEQSYELTAKGWKLSGIITPEQSEVEPGDAVAPLSLHLAIFTK